MFKEALDCRNDLIIVITISLNNTFINYQDFFSITEDEKRYYNLFYYYGSLVLLNYCFFFIEISYLKFFVVSTFHTYFIYWTYYL